MTNPRCLCPKPLFVSICLDRRERHPLSCASFLRGQKLAAQQVLLLSTGSHNVPKAHITKADRIWWAVGMKISSGCCKQEFQFRSKVLSGTPRHGVTARGRSRVAGCEAERDDEQEEMLHGSWREVGPAETKVRSAVEHDSRQPRRAAKRLTGAK